MAILERGFEYLAAVRRTRAKEVEGDEDWAGCAER